jgi:pyruvate/2-oxoglutarate/acetoin dehydrogenase E1 component/TPP-dependent pyruvate/acetoin dehydrogenase alpha subunit
MDPLQLSEQDQAEALSYEAFKNAVIADYTLAHQSRQASLLGRKEVLTGKAKFGIFGDGKEVPQVAMAKFFKPGDFYAGYYRDQTFAFATGAATIHQFFAQLYADPDPAHDPHSAGRNMNNHFGSQLLDENGEFIDFTRHKNLTSGLAPTAGHLPKALGLAYASRLFRRVDALKDLSQFSHNGDEVCFCTIGDASTSEGHFWETMNAAAVSQVPLAVFVWDDGYGISVPKEFQTVKSSISEALSGFEKERGTNGMLIYKVKGWDYAQLCEVFEEGISIARKEHIPVLFHVEELTQPQGHSTSGSHERYKSPERLQWEREWDCLAKMRSWILENGLLSLDELESLEDSSRKYVSECKLQSWRAYEDPILEQKNRAISLIGELNATIQHDQLNEVYQELKNNPVPFRRDIMSALFRSIHLAGNGSNLQAIRAYYEELKQLNRGMFNSHLQLSTEQFTDAVLPELHFDEEAPVINGYEILNRYFDALFAANNKVVAFGEDVGKIGDVNQGFAGLQNKYGRDRIFDTGIRELTIIGQGVGMAMRGLRPIAEIQYLDYLLYGITILSDDAASLHYRSAGTQVAPIIVRTRGHRLEGIWHSGSPMGLLINALKGFRLCVPRNMVQAVGFYNALLAEKEPGLVIECLNGYRLKEKQPSSLLNYILPLGIPELMREGNDLTIVSYGSTLRLVLEAAEMLTSLNIDVEVLDVQTLMPFDVQNKILDSLKKTNRIMFVDEDVPGGATSFMYADVMDRQGGYRWLDASARILCAHAHRPAYGSDGDYFSKPNVEDIVALAIEVMAE